MLQTGECESARVGRESDCNLRSVLSGREGPGYQIFCAHLKESESVKCQVCASACEQRSQSPESRGGRFSRQTQRCSALLLSQKRCYPLAGRLFVLPGSLEQASPCTTVGHQPFSSCHDQTSNTKFLCSFHVFFRVPVSHNTTQKTLSWAQLLI